MKKISLLALASLMLGLGALSQAHSIKNTGDHPVHAWIGYYGEVKWMKSCRTDEGLIKPGESLTSNPGLCELKFVQIQDGNKVIKYPVGTQDPFSLTFLAAPLVQSPTGERMAMIVGGKTEWEYDGVNLLPLKDVLVVQPTGKALDLKVIARY